MASDYRLEYTSPDGLSKIVLDPNAVSGPFMLLPTPDGMLAPARSFNSRKAPAQPGSTLTDTVIGERSSAVQFAILGKNANDYWTRRKEAAAALAVPRSTIGDIPPEGLLRAFRPGQPVVQVRCLPRAPRESGRPDRLSLVVDVEFIAHDPYWREETIVSVDLRADGGFEFPLEHPWESGANNIEQEVNNTGSVPAPMIARLYGEFTTGRLINVTTGETLEYTGAVAAGEHIEIDTSFGKKSVTHVATDGTRTPDMANMNLDISDFWSLIRGPQTVRFEADLNPSGYANIQYQTRHGGI